MPHDPRFGAGGGRALGGDPRDVPPYAIVAGNPARVVRRRLSETDAARMRRIAWWDRDAPTITRLLPAIGAGDVDALEAASGIDRM